MENITVAIPVGPHECYRQWLSECLASVVKQTIPSHIDILLIDDKANISGDEFIKLIYDTANLCGYNKPEDIGEDTADLSESNSAYDRYIHMWKTPWNVGVADAFNFGVALSETNLVFMLGSDDVLMPTCLEECVKEYEKKKIEGWYSVTLKYMTSGQKQWIPCNAAMVTKKLWENTGGFPPSAGVGGCDALLLSILMTHMPERIIMVKQHTPLYLAREHEHQDTKKNMSFFAQSGIIEIIRNLETQRWKPKNAKT